MKELYVLVALTQWREPFDRKVGRPQSRTGRCGGEKHYFPCP
jgi:hypothetical protein